VTFAVDEQQARRPVPTSNATLGYSTEAGPVDVCAIKRAGIAMFSYKDRLFYARVSKQTSHLVFSLMEVQEIPLPQGMNAVLARRTGRYLCFADHENYNIIDLDEAQLFPVLPISQAPRQDGMQIKPHITVISENEFLILSWTGASTMGLFITGNGDPVRGTLEWDSYPLGICEFFTLWWPQSF